MYFIIPVNTITRDLIISFNNSFQKNIRIIFPFPLKTILRIKIYLITFVNPNNLSIKKNIPFNLSTF